MRKGSRQKSAQPKVQLLSVNSHIAKLVGISDTSTFTPAAIHSGPAGCGPLSADDGGGEGAAGTQEVQTLLTQLTQLLMQNRVPILA
jgi:hypothetical protein